MTQKSWVVQVFLSTLTRCMNKCCLICYSSHRLSSKLVTHVYGEQISFSSKLNCIWQWPSYIVCDPIVLYITQSYCLWPGNVVCDSVMFHLTVTQLCFKWPSYVVCDPVMLPVTLLSCLWLWLSYIVLNQLWCLWLWPRYVVYGDHGDVHFICHIIANMFHIMDMLS